MNWLRFAVNIFVVSAAVIRSSPDASFLNANDKQYELQNVTSIDDVFTPPKGTSQMKFSYPNPEPSVPYAGFLFGFEIISFSKNYGLDPNSTVVHRNPSGISLNSTGLTWAGGQQRASGNVLAHIYTTKEGYIEWQVNGSLPNGDKIKSIKTILRNFPRGNISSAAEDWSDPGENELVYEYPYINNAMGTPLMAVKSDNGLFWGISSIQKEVRPARFAFFPGSKSYKVDLVYEQAGWQKKSTIESAVWRIVGPKNDFKDIADTHFKEVARNWEWESFSTRKDAPDWMRNISLVVTLHGEHWTGFVHNSFKQQLDILKWVSTQIDPRNVMVFVTGWDGRYYYSYPTYEIGDFPGGEAGFSELITEGHKLGYHFALMFGSNSADPSMPSFRNVSNAQLRTLYQDPFPGDIPDWDGDRHHSDGSMVYMNLAVPSWREHLYNRIASKIDHYGVDAYFLDICGLWENNLDGDMLLGLKTMVKDLEKKYPGVPAIAEMLFDAQMGFIPMNQAPKFAIFSEANYGIAPSFNHLSWPSPNTGSTGIHELGFNTYQPVTEDQQQIPTITFAYDTFKDQRDAVMKDISTAKRWFARRGNTTEIHSKLKDILQ